MMHSPDEIVFELSSDDAPMVNALYRCPLTHRLFNVVLQENGLYYLEELQPTGRLQVSVDNTTQFDESRAVYEILEYHPPNEFFDVAGSRGINPHQVVLQASPRPASAATFPTLRDCAAAIHSALRANRWYDPTPYFAEAQT